MNNPDALPAFLIAVASGVVLGVAVLLTVYKMIDGNIPLLPGLCALIMMGLAEALAIRPPHPAVPGVVLVSALALMVFFPFAEQKLEEFEMRAVQAGQMAKSFKAVEVRPDNYAAVFELAHILHDHGFVAQAIQITGASLARLSVDKDDVQNRSLRDVFYKEEILLKRWQHEPPTAPLVKCPSCGRMNEPGDLFCRQCHRPYLLDIVQGQEVKPRVWAKLILAWTALALFIPGVVAIGMSLEGSLQIGAFAIALGLVGGLLAWLFKAPKHSVATWGVD